jgi:hypothetical protein
MAFYGHGVRVLWKHPPKPPMPRRETYFCASKDGSGVLSFSWGEDRQISSIAVDYTERCGAAGVVVACVTLVLTPWIIRNYMVHRAFVPLTTEGGYTFWCTNYPGAIGGGECPAPPNLEQFRGLSEVEVDDRFYEMGKDAIRRHPMNFLRLLGVKFINFWRPWPHAKYVGLRTAIVGGVSFVPVALLGIWGGARIGSRWQPALLLLLLFACMTAVHMLYMAVTRYRTPIMPAAIVFASLGLVGLWRRVRGH